MKTIRHLVLISLLATSCSGPIQNDSQQVSSSDSFNADRTTKRFANSHEAAELKNPAETHLKDTSYIKGSYVLFLRPDDNTFESYAKDENNGIYEIDSDFGFAIAATLDTMAKYKRYKNIKTDITTARYFVIQDCKNGPLVIDRDSISYGLLLTRKGYTIQTSTFVHSGDYLEEVDDYFKVRK